MYLFIQPGHQQRRAREERRERERATTTYRLRVWTIRMMGHRVSVLRLPSWDSDSAVPEQRSEGLACWCFFQLRRSSCQREPDTAANMAYHPSSSCCSPLGWPQSVARRQSSAGQLELCPLERLPVPVPADSSSSSYSPRRTPLVEAWYAKS